MRSTFAELHQCTLRVKPDSASQVTLHLTWNKSMKRWDEVMEQEKQGMLPAHLASLLRAKSSEVIGTYRFDDLRSTCCLYDYATAVSRSNGGGESSTQAIIDHVVTSEQSKALLQDWIGLRAASKFVTRLIEFDFRSADDGGSSAGGPESIIADKTCHVRLKLPTLLGGVSTPWIPLGRFSLSGYVGLTIFTMYATSIRAPKSL